MKLRYLAVGIGLTILALSGAPPVHAQEFRGIWVDAFDTGFKTPEQTTEMVNRLADANLNAVFVQVRKRGDAYYNSAVEPRAKDLLGDYDPLADIVQKAHARGLEVHAWITVFEVWSTYRPYKQTIPGHVFVTHPDWLTKNDKGQISWTNGAIYLDPGLPEVREHIKSVVMDIVTHYDVDGIHLDGVWYPSFHSGYNEKAISLYNTESGKAGTPRFDDPDWCNWRRTQINTLLKELYSAVTSAKRKVKMTSTAHAHRDRAYDYYLQDWDTWMRERLLDALVPMVYTANDSNFSMYADTAQSSAWAGHIYIGIGSWRQADEKNLLQLLTCRTKTVRGFVLFDYTTASTPAESGGTPLLDYLKSSALSDRAATPAMSWK